MIIIAAAFVFASASAAPLQTEDWRYGGSSPTFAYGYEHSSIRTYESIRIVRTVIVEAETTSAEWGPPVDYLAPVTTIDCEAGTIRDDYPVGYLLNQLGRVRRLGDDLEGTARRPLPGSAGVTLIDLVCGEPLGGPTLARDRLGAAQALRLRLQLARP